MILFIQPQPLEKHSPASTAGLTAEPTAGLLNRRYLRYLLVIFIAMFSMYLAQPLSQNFLQNQHGLNLVQIGQLIAFRSLGIIAINLLLGHLNARTGFLLAQVIMIFFTLLLGQGQSYPMFILSYFLLGSYQTAR